MSVITAHIDRLRHLAPEAGRVPTRDQLAAIAADIYGGVPLERTLRRAELAGFTAVEVCTIAEEFGKFRARSNKGGPKAETLLVEESGFLPLPGLLPTRAEVQRRAEQATKVATAQTRRDGSAARTRWSQLVDPALLAEHPAVIIPPGYEPAALGRNIRASLAALAITMPTDAEVDRFWNRRYAETEAELTAEHIHLVWWLAVHRLGSKLDELDGKTATLNGLLVRAHDTLETARTDAVAALTALSAPAAATADPDDLSGWVDAASWTHPGLLGRLGRLTGALAAADEPRLRSLLSGRLGTVADWFTGSREAFGDLGSLTEGHLRLLTERFGLAHDAVEERRVRNEIRARLTSIGLAADLDQELPAALSAWRTGRLEEFYSSREARAAGDPDWQLLATAVEEATVAMVPDPAAAG